MGDPAPTAGWTLRSVLASFAPRANLRYLGALFRWVWKTARDLRRRRRESRLTIAVDISPFWEPLTGIGWYLYRLLEELAPRTDLAIRLYGPDLTDASPSARIVVQPPSGPALEHVSCKPPGHRGIALSAVTVRAARLLAPVLLAADRNRVLFAPNYFPPRRWILAEAAGTPLVATIHDLSYRQVPWAVRRETREDLERHLGRVWSRAAAILTDSEAVRREILDADLAAPDRVRTVHLAAARRRSEPGPLPAGAPDRYGLFVGTVEPRKNLDTLLDAWNGLRRRLAEPPALVVCGRIGWESQSLTRRIERAESEGWLRHFGYVGDPELAALYRRALLVALPSHYEGFGLPVLEAFDAGVPVVASDLPVLREVGGDAALYAPPGRPDLWESRIAELVDDPALRDELAHRGRERGGRFSWTRTAEETLAVLREAAPRG